ncbi:hypothetical protein LSA_02800 [Fructilactobacillus sanfranciscensis TMW 1.1304]|uniref:Uncharacterized protein n=1 Tax=Fructilactobacillus sanfranciscensis (strain TMW 1.1304) TaxID=714313 RepID=G2KTC1_FRUST|nr:hypothetical protein LSA_02800 [Fructilactobacillus sanfranciscensis TMW 1.1304]
MKSLFRKKRHHWFVRTKNSLSKNSKNLGSYLFRNWGHYWNWDFCANW